MSDKRGDIEIFGTFFPFNENEKTIEEFGKNEKNNIKNLEEQFIKFSEEIDEKFKECFDLEKEPNIIINFRSGDVMKKDDRLILMTEEERILSKIVFDKICKSQSKYPSKFGFLLEYKFKIEKIKKNLYLITEYFCIEKSTIKF
jgi:molybdopterin converting factor small subunit